MYQNLMSQPINYAFSTQAPLMLINFIGPNISYDVNDASQFNSFEQPDLDFEFSDTTAGIHHTWSITISYDTTSSKEYYIQMAITSKGLFVLNYIL